jgi:LDH2 family malate/lactate/ureidoglycolate dehydrogenase
MPVFNAQYLKGVASNIFLLSGAPAAVADLVADALVEANLVGHDSHGLIRIVEYLKQIQDGKVNPAAEPEIVKESATTLLVDGHHGFGQLVARWAMERIIEKARGSYTAAACVLNCGHVGLTGTYPAMAAEQGMVGMAFVNGGGSKPRVVPFGGGSPMFGTNPLAAALPVKDARPIVLDFSTSVVASGKIRVYRDKGEPLPEGWILDSQGRPSRDPKEYYDGGMLLPAGGHKGSGLALLVEVLAGLLSGSGSLILPESGYGGGNGVFLWVLNVEAFQPQEHFSSQVGRMADVLRATRPCAGSPGVLIPGDPEEATRQERLSKGIDIPQKTWDQIVEAASRLGVSI